MPVQRKIFRIEQDACAGGRVDVSARDAEAALRHHEFMAEIKALRGLIEPRAETNRAAIETSRAQIAEAQAYKAELETIHAALKRSREEVAAFAGGGALPPDIARASRELDAIVRGTEQATQQLLQAAEDIDQCANTLSAGLKSEHEKGLANDIRDRVVQIFEFLQFPGSDRAAGRQGGRGPGVPRGACRPPDGNLVRRRAVQAGRVRRRARRRQEIAQRPEARRRRRPLLAERHQLVVRLTALGGWPPDRGKTSQRNHRECCRCRQRRRIGHALDHDG